MRTQYLDLEESTEGVTISISHGDDDVQQNILLADVTYDDLYQGDSSSALALAKFYKNDRRQ
ncbi:hypothetical protein OH492_10505 [Vibrio chagasii]|nr:hypothetical protein [Vibrio chagasii]